ncbi:hypothetical protein QBC47DRAFT_292019, partial [Echria macrotheca]
CSRSQTVQARYFPDLKSQRVLVKYGPFPVPPIGNSHTMGNFTLPIPLPCSNCTVTHVLGGLEYPNGTTANTNTGMYLHHAVVFNYNDLSVTCAERKIPAPVFASGNERTVISPSLSGTKKAGIPIKDNDKYYLVAELMNEANQTREVFVTVDWEYVPSPSADFQVITPVWLDVNGTCFEHGSEVEVPVNQTTFSLVMNPAWTSPFAGEVVEIMSHLHDGGQDVLVYKNGGVVCNAKARYGERPGYVSPGDHSDHHHDDDDHDHDDHDHEHHGGHDSVNTLQKRHEDRVHISSISGCTNVGRIEVGDKWSVTAEYNLTRNMPMMMGGHYEPVMGISVLFVAKDTK